MSYEPTGRPPGRPRKDDQSRTPKPQPPVSTKNFKIPPSVEPKQPYTGPKPVKIAPDNAAADHRTGPAPICPECYPDGWPHKATGLACRHGIWSRPWRP